MRTAFYVMFITLFVGLFVVDADAHYTIVSWIIVVALLLACDYFFER